MAEDFKAIVITRPPFDKRVANRKSPRSPRNVAYAFADFTSALAFMQVAKFGTVLVEFSVENDTLDFYDAAKALKVPVIFSANRLEPSQIIQFGIETCDIVYPERRRSRDVISHYRPEFGLRDSRSNINLMVSSAELDA